MEVALFSILATLSIALEVVGAAIIVGAAVLALAELGRAAIRDRRFVWLEVRRLFGRGLVLGLEFLIGADVLRTIVAPTLEDLAILGAIIVLRTILSLSIEFELRGATDESDDRRA